MTSFVNKRQKNMKKNTHFDEEMVNVIDLQKKDHFHLMKNMKKHENRKYQLLCRSIIQRQHLCSFLTFIFDLTLSARNIEHVSFVAHSGIPLVKRK
jgi:phosphate uptake regulator